MDANTFELYRALESGPYDEAGLSQVKRLLGVERRALRANNDLKALELLIPLLQRWASAAGGGWLSASALGEAAEIAELDLRNTARAEELRTQAISTGRTASGTPLPLQAAEPTQEMHTVDIEIGSTPSLMPLPDDDALTAEIAHAEHVLEVDSSPERVRELADLYARREAPGDRDNAAQLYCTLGEMLGNPAGVPMLERAIALMPEHAEAKALLMRYAVKPRRVSSPKITLLGVPPRGMPQPPPPVAAGLIAAKPGNPPPPAAGASVSLQPTAVVTDAALALEPSAAPQSNALPAPKPGLSGSLAPKTAAGAALANAAARISSRPPAVRSASRPAGRRSSTSPGFLTASGATALAADDHAIPLETIAVESQPPLAAAVAQEQPAARDSLAPVAVPELKPSNDAELASGADELHAPDVLQLHGIPQVKTVPPSVPEIASLTPVVRSDAAELHASRIPTTTRRTLTLGAIALSAAAAFGIYVATGDKDQSASPRPTAASSAPAKGALAMPTPPLADAKTGAKPGPVAAPAAEALDQEEEEPAKPAPAVAASLKKAVETPAPLAPPGPSHLPKLKLETAKLKGGKLNEAQLAQALSKAEPKLLACYAQAIEHKPKLKGRILYSFTIRTTGKASNVKRAGGTLKDDAVVQCSEKVLEGVRFPKPRKATQVKLPIQYKRT